MEFSHWNIEVQRALMATAVHNGRELPQKWKPVAEASSLPFASSPSAGSRSTLVRMCDSRSLRRLVDLDVVGSKLMEVNVFSPGEIGSVSSLHEVDFAPLATL